MMLWDRAGMGIWVSNLKCHLGAHQLGLGGSLGGTCRFCLPRGRTSSHDTPWKCPLHFLVSQAHCGKQELRAGPRGAATQWAAGGGSLRKGGGPSSLVGARSLPFWKLSPRAQPRMGSSCAPVGGSVLSLAVAFATF